MDGERITNGRRDAAPPAGSNGTNSSDERPIVMVLSTGCCGTEWLANGLRRLHPDVVAEHEPIGPSYLPRRYFRHYEHPEAILDVPVVAAHVDAIERSTNTYVETGWPLFPVLPLMAERAPQRLRIIHLTRHPVPTSLSHLANDSFAGSPRPNAYTDHATLGPNDPNVFQPGYAATWEELSAYEKCLFWWTEVHMFGLEVPGRLEGVPLLRLQSEPMLAGDHDTLQQLVEFIGLPWREDWLEHADRTVDRWYHHTDREVDPLQVHRHPVTVEVAHRLGYDLSGLNLGELLAHYEGEPAPGRDRAGRSG
jgi:hypothetical protein